MATLHSLVQVDWDLASVGAPGVTVSVALMGGLAKNFNTGCWSLYLEISLGISFGLSLFGGKLGLGIGIVGASVTHYLRCPVPAQPLVPPLPHAKLS